jgi:hypothetical protein
MTVHGYELTEAQIKTILMRMKDAPFTAADIANIATATGIPMVDENHNPVAYRVADRMIQKVRHMGCLKMSSKPPIWNRLEADLLPAQFL